MTVGRASVQRLLRLLATIGAALVLVVIVSSAYLRLSQAGLSCADWPACYGNLAHVMKTTTAQNGARLAHRLAASAVFIVLLALFSVAFAQRPRLAKQARIVGAALAVATALAMIGAVTSESARITPLPAVTLANLGGGFALLALFWWLRQTVLAPDVPMASARFRSALPQSAASREPRIVPRGVRALAFVALLAVIVQIALGGLVSAKFAALACPAFPLCGAETSAGALFPSLAPFATLDVDASKSIVRPPALATLHWAHRVGAHIVLALAAILAALLARAGRRREAGVVAAITIAVIALGAGSILAALPLIVVLAHNLAAALLLAVLVAINYRVRARAAS